MFTTIDYAVELRDTLELNGTFIRREKYSVRTQNKVNVFTCYGINILNVQILKCIIFILSCCSWMPNNINESQQHQEPYNNHGYLIISIMDPKPIQNSTEFL